VLVYACTAPSHCAEGITQPSRVGAGVGNPALALLPLLLPKGVPPVEVGDPGMWELLVVERDYVPMLWRVTESKSWCRSVLRVTARHCMAQALYDRFGAHLERTARSTVRY
jgi:hypothetical protein